MIQYIVYQSIKAVLLLVHLSQKAIEAIEKAISKGGRTEAVVRIEDGKAVVLQVERKKIS